MGYHPAKTCGAEVSSWHAKLFSCRPALTVLTKVKCSAWLSTDLIPSCKRPTDSERGLRKLAKDHPARKTRGRSFKQANLSLRPTLYSETPCLDSHTDNLFNTYFLLEIVTQKSKAKPRPRLSIRTPERKAWKKREFTPVRLEAASIPLLPPIRLSSPAKLGVKQIYVQLLQLGQVSESISQRPGSIIASEASINARKLHATDTLKSEDSEIFQGLLGAGRTQISAGW